jgi:hypothetical protein
MLDLSRDPSAAGVLNPAREVGGAVPFLSELDLAEFASSSLRNCSLFMLAAVDVEWLVQLSLGARGYQVAPKELRGTGKVGQFWGAAAVR